MRRHRFSLLSAALLVVSLVPAGRAIAQEVDEEGESVSAATAGEPNVLGSTEFFVEEFIPNRLKVQADAPERRFSPREPLEVTVKAEEMFGQPAGGRPVSAIASFSAQAFEPKDFKGYSFGDPDRKFEKMVRELPEAELDNAGKAQIEVALPEDAKPPAALLVRVQTTVKETGGRGVTAVVERTIDPVPFYIGIRQMAETYATSGRDTDFEIVAVKPDGTLSDAQALTATVSRVRYNSILKREGGSYRYETNRELVAVQDSALALADGKGKVTWKAGDSGSYMLRVCDPVSGSCSALSFYVTSGEWSQQPWSLEKPERIELALDRPMYAPGDTARLLVKAPFAGTLLLTLEQDRILTSTVTEMKENTLEVPIVLDAGFLPNVYAVATVLRPVTPAEKWMPHRAFGVVNIPLQAQGRRLAVEIGAPVEVRPMQDLAVTVALKDSATSAPVEGDVTLWAVDEGVLSLTGFETPDPFGFFYAARRLMVMTSDFFSALMPDLISPAKEKSAAGGGDEGSLRKRRSPVASERVKPVVLWGGTRHTDPQGSLTATFKVPQFMGRLRVMAVASQRNQFGSSDKTVFVRSPLMVKEGLPRFLAPGDIAAVPFTVFNNTDAPVSGSLELRTSGTLALAAQAGGDAGQSLPPIKFEIPPRGEKVLMATVSAAKRAGVGSVGFEAKAGNERYADSVELPVRPASPFVTMAGYDTVTAGDTKTIAIPGGDFLAGTSTGTLVVSGLPAVQLRGGLDYLVHYPYGCVEQTVSASFPLLFLGDLAKQVAPGTYSDDALQTLVQAGVDRVLSMQTASGGMGMWSGSREPWTWGSAYAAHFLAEAKKAGFVVPDEYFAELLSYLDAQLAGKPQPPVSDSLTERAYILYVSALAGRKNPGRMESLYEQRADLTVTARALLAAAYRTTGANAEAATLLEMANDADATTQGAARSTGGILASPARETAILLAAQLDSDPTAPVVPGLVKRLQGYASKRGYWATTQDNAFALWALGRYAKVQAAQPQEFTGRVRVANGDPTTFSATAPVSISKGVTGSDVAVSVEGPGTAYVAWSAEGVPALADTAEMSQGIKVTRKFTTRAGKPLDPMSLEQGQLLVVEIELASDRALDNVVIEDLLPAGLEIENANLATAEKLDEADAEVPEAISVQRTEALDDRMVAFVDITVNPPGKRVFKYAARAVTQGEFTLPAVQASCMYDPEIQARGGAGRVKVVPRR